MRKKEIHSTSYILANFKEDMHIMPMDDWFEHLADVNCPCNPYMDEKNKVDMVRGYADQYIWVHRRVKGNKQEMN